MKIGMISFLLGFCIFSASAQNELSPQVFDLDASINYGLKHKPSLQSKALEQQAANELRQNAYRQLMPELSANASLDHYWQIPVQAFPAELVGGPEGEFIPVRVGTPWNINAGLNAEIDLINVDKWKDIRVANIRQQMNDYAFENEEALLKQNIALAYYNAQLAKRQAGFARQNYEVQQELLHFTKARLDEGLTEQIAYNRVENTMLNARNQWGSSQKNAENQLLQLKFWMGMQVEADIQLAGESWKADVAYHVDSLRLQTHPAFQAMRSQVLLAESQMQQLSVSRLPKLTAYAAYSQLAFRNKFDFFDSNEDWYSTGQVGLKLNVPIFSRGVIAGEVKVNRLQAAQAQQRLRDFELEKNIQYQQLRNDLRNSIESISSHERQLTLAQENQRIARVKYESGVYTTSELLDVQGEMLQAQRGYLEAFAQYYSTQAEINYLLQK